MEAFSNYVAVQWLFPAAVIFLLVGAAFAFVVGAGLVIRSSAMIGFFATMNRWVSTRKMMKSADTAHDLDTILRRQAGALGAAILVGAGLTLVVLLLDFDVDAVVDIFRHQFAPVLVELVARSAKWILVVGLLAAIALGIALIFFPAALAALEARANRRYSFRARGRDLDLMHLSIDHWVESYPRAFGFLILSLALFIMVSLGATFLGRA